MLKKQLAFCFERCQLTLTNEFANDDGHSLQSLTLAMCRGYGPTNNVVDKFNDATNVFERKFSCEFQSKLCTVLVKPTQQLNSPLETWRHHDVVGDAKLPQSDPDQIEIQPLLMRK
jgi:hypothetical protein